MRTTATRRIAAGLLAATTGIALAVSGLLAPAPAQAAPAGAASSVDPSARGSITVVKYDMPPAPGGPHNGLEDTDGAIGKDRTPMAGIPFTVCTALNPATGDPFDFTTEAGWAALANYNSSMSAPVQCAPADSTYVDTATTGVDGKASFDNLRLGAYWVFEERMPDSTIQPVAPFLVTVPMTHPTDRDHWLYDVFVYPKSSVVKASKKVVDDEARVHGDPIKWEIRANVPYDHVDDFDIHDTLDDQLSYQSVKVSIEGSRDPAMREGTDYRVVRDGQKIHIDFLDAGFKILNANNGETLLAELTTQVRPGLDPSDELIGITNTVYLTFNNMSLGQVVAESPASQWGALDVQKHETGRPELTLPGTHFRLYRTEDDALADTNPITVDGVDTFITNEKGLTRIGGLRASNYANGVLLDESKWQPYFLIEYKAPVIQENGKTVEYERIEEPMPVYVLNNDSGIDRVVQNPRKVGPSPDPTPTPNPTDKPNPAKTGSTPRTDGIQVAGFVGVGALLILASAGMYAASRKANREN